MTYKQLTVYHIQEIQGMSQDKDLKHLQEHIIRGWLEHRDQVPQHMRTYWTFQDDMALVDGVILKSRHTVIPDALKRETLEQLYVS